MDEGRPLHRLTNIDREARTAVCSVCGPTRIRYRPGKGGECNGYHREYQRRTAGKGDKRRRQSRVSIYAPMLERLRDRMRVRDDGCWEWLGALDRDGYGKWGNSSAHRHAFELFAGPVPDGLVLDHICHTAVCAGGVTCSHRRCVNPNHLLPTTPEANNRRGTFRWTDETPAQPSGADGWAGDLAS